MNNTKQNRRMLQNIVKGGNGVVEGVVYPLPEPDAYGNHYYFVEDGITYLVHTESEAAKLQQTLKNLI